MFYLHKTGEESGDSGIEYQFILSPVDNSPTDNPVTGIDATRDEALDAATIYIDQNYKERAWYSLFWLG